MDDWEKFKETSLPEKEDFYSHLNTEVLLMKIKHTQKEFVKILNIMICMFKAIHYCCLIYLRTVEMCLIIYELDPAKFLLPPGLAWQAALRMAKVKLDLLIGIRGGICHSIYRYAKASNKYMKHYDKK